MDKEKAVSVTTGFIINFGIATVLVAIMLFLFQGILTQVLDQTTGSEMRVTGEKVSSELQKADRLAQRGNGSLEIKLPQFEQQYTVTITGDKDGQIFVDSGTVKVDVDYSVSSEITNDEYSTSAGGRIVMEYRNVSDGEIELR